MTQKELIAIVANQCELPKTQAKEVVLTILDTIEEELVDGGVVQFPGFGTFKTVERAARKGCNPATGEAMDFPASTSPKFKAGAALRRAVKGN